MHLFKWLLGIAVVVNAAQSGTSQNNSTKKNLTTSIGGGKATKTAVKLASNTKADALGPDHQDLAVDGGAATTMTVKDTVPTTSILTTQTNSKRAASSTRTRNAHPPKLSTRTKATVGKPSKPAFKPGASCAKDNIKVSPDDQDGLSREINLESQKVLDTELQAAFNEANPGRKTRILTAGSKSASKTVKSPSGHGGTSTKVASGLAGLSKRTAASYATAPNQGHTKSTGTALLSGTSKVLGSACKTRPKRDVGTPDLEILEVRQTFVPESSPVQKIGVITAARDQPSSLELGNGGCSDQEVTTVTHETAMCYSRVGARHVATGVSCTTTMTSVETGPCLTATTTSVLTSLGASSGYLPIMAQPSPAMNLPLDVQNGLPKEAELQYRLHGQDTVCSWNGASVVIERLFGNEAPLCTLDGALIL